VLVHGTGTELVPPDFPPLSDAEVRRLLARVPSVAAFASSARVVWHSPRPFSATALVALDEGPEAAALGTRRRPSPRAASEVKPDGSGGTPLSLVVKRHSRLARSPASLEAEHAFMRHLASRGLAVPRALDDGTSSAWEEGGFVYEVQEVLAGEDLYANEPSWTPYMSETHAASAGVALARLHLASAGFSQPPRPVEPLYATAAVVSSEDPLAATEGLGLLLPGLGQFLRARASWRAELARALGPYHQAFLPCARELEATWAHNDWHPSNLLWSLGSQGEDVAGVIDFSLANLTSTAYDLATALERSVVRWLLPPDRWAANFGQAGALLRGYMSLRPLGAAEARALPRLLPMVHVDYALSEVDYYMRVAGSPANAGVAWETYLIGHLGWWATPGGQQFCRYVGQLLAG